MTTAVRHGMHAALDPKMGPFLRELLRQLKDQRDGIGSGFALHGQTPRYELEPITRPAILKAGLRRTEEPNRRSDRENRETSKKRRVDREETGSSSSSRETGEYRSRKRDVPQKQVLPRVREGSRSRTPEVIALAAAAPPYTPTANPAAPPYTPTPNPVDSTNGQLTTEEGPEDENDELMINIPRAETFQGEALSEEEGDVDLIHSTDEDSDEEERNRLEGTSAQRQKWDKKIRSVEQSCLKRTPEDKWRILRKSGAVRAKLGSEGYYNEIMTVFTYLRSDSKMFEDFLNTQLN